MFLLKNYFGNSKTYFIPVLVFCAGGMLIHLFMPFDVISLEVNKRYTHSLNYFFKYITVLGDGFFVVFLGLALRWLDKRVSQKIFVAYILVSVLCSFLKQVVFKGMPRPIEHFAELYPVLNLIDGVQISRWNTFPSGHSAAAFTLFTVLAVWIRNPLGQIMFAFLAILVGFSRVYLFEHFLRDVLAGALIGCLAALCTEYISHRLNASSERNRSSGIIAGGPK